MCKKIAGMCLPPHSFSLTLSTNCCFLTCERVPCPVWSRLSFPCSNSSPDSHLSIFSPSLFSSERPLDAVVTPPGPQLNLMAESDPSISPDPSTPAHAPCIANDLGSCFLVTCSSIDRKRPCRSVAPHIHPCAYVSFTDSVPMVLAFIMILSPDKVSIQYIAFFLLSVPFPCLSLSIACHPFDIFLASFPLLSLAKWA